MTFKNLDSVTPEDRRRSTARTARLVLQAALREGLLSGCRQVWSDGILTLEGNGAVIRVKGAPAGDGDRFFLDPGGLSLELPEFLGRMRMLSGLEEDHQGWRRLEEEMCEAHLTQAVSYAAGRTRPEPREYLDFEGWTPEGHNLHPGAKTRSQFSTRDQLRYAPELAEAVELPWIGVDKGLLSVSGRIDSLLEEDGDTWAMPVHPWQRDNVLEAVYADEWRHGSIRDLDREPVRCRLCTSLRTVVPDDPDLPVLKTSVGCLMTSTDRSMSRYTVLQGPVYTEYLGRVAEAAPDLFERVVALEETGGFCWADGTDTRRSRNLSLLFRQRPPGVERGIAVPCSTLPQPTWCGDSTYFGELFRQGRGTEANFKDYLRLVVPFHLELYLRYGVALEAHLQNCVVVWEEGFPARLWVRDWGGLRADGERFSRFAPDLHARLNPNSVTLTDAVTAEKKLIACLFCNHLTEVVAGVSRACEVAEPDLWREVARVTAESLQPYRNSELRRRVLEEEWPVKCLLKMRLGLGGSGDVYRYRRNPLRESSVG